MPYAPPGTVDALHAAIESFGAYIRTQGRGEIPSALFGPHLLTVLDPQEHPEVLHVLVQNLPHVSCEWKFVLQSLLAAREDPVLDRLDPLVAAMRALVKIAANERLWVARVLAAACDGFSAAAANSACDDVGARNALLDTAATTIRQAFRVTVTDHESEIPKEGRTKTCYAVGVCLLRLYTRMHAYSLANGIMRALAGYARNIAPLEASSPQTRVQFLFYEGVYAFGEQKYVLACERLQLALQLAQAHQPLTSAQFEHIMAYQIPAKFLTKNEAPTQAVWALLPRLRLLYEPLLTATRRGDYAAFQEHLQQHAKILRGQRLYLACDRLVPKLRLNLLRRCWEILTRPKRIPIATYALALQTAGFAPTTLATEGAAEFYMSQFVMSGQVKGYIHHELQLLMVSKTQPFPTLVRAVASE